MALAWYFGKNYCPVCKQKSLSVYPQEIKCDACKAFMARPNFMERVVIWTRGKSVWWRAALIIYFIYLLTRNLENGMYAMQRGANFFSFIDFGIHELGHVLFVPFGVFMTILGGSLFQCLFPLFWIAGFVQIKWYFAACLCLPWLGLNLFDVATYAADARARLLPLATFSNDYDSAHDWYQILSRTGHLDRDLAYASYMRVAAVGAFVLGLTLATAILVIMAYQNRLVKKEKANLSPVS